MISQREFTEAAEQYLDMVYRYKWQITHIKNTGTGGKSVYKSLQNRYNISQRH